MRIPSAFKIGILNWNVKLTDKITVVDNEGLDVFSRGDISKKTINGGGLLFGLCDPATQTLWLATKDSSGNDLSKERIISTFYHELSHALVGETANLDLYHDEVFIEALGKNLFSYCVTLSDKDASEEDDDEDEEIKESKPKSKKK